jgi:hypothetical protein
MAPVFAQLAGAGVTVYGIGLWSVALAVVLGGLALLGFGTLAELEQKRKVARRAG